MLKVSPCKEKTSTNCLKQDEQKILHFSLQGVLPAGHTLVLNTKSGTLSHLALDGDRARLLMQQQFTNSEISVLLPLLEQFPHYCPYEVLFASFYNNSVTELTVAHCRQRLQKAMEAGTWDQEMRPLRTVLSRARLKMRVFGIDISSILETGYILMVLSTPKSVGDG